MVLDLAKISSIVHEKAQALKDNNQYVDLNIFIKILNFHPSKYTTTKIKKISYGLGENICKLYVHQKAHTQSRPQVRFWVTMD